MDHFIEKLVIFHKKQIQITQFHQILLKVNNKQIQSSLLNLFIILLLKQSYTHSSQPMKARHQRTHYMGFSNRNPFQNLKSTTADLYQRSFTKSKSQFYQPSAKLNATSQSVVNQQQIRDKAYTSQLNFNSLYKQSQKGHHYQFQTNKLGKTQKKSIHLQNFQTKIIPNPLPLNLNYRLNEKIVKVKKSFQNQEINLHKLKELKATFLKNNEKRRNLKDYFNQYADSQSGMIQKKGFKSLIKQYGYDVSDKEIQLMFNINDAHSNRGESIEPNKTSSLNLEQFISLMTKQNIFFSTIKLNQNKHFIESTFRFKPADFQIFRNKFSRLKEAFYVYKGQSVTAGIYEKIMKKLDINDLVLKQDKRLSIFNEFANQKGQLNVQKLLSVIATQQHERVRASGNQLKIKSYDNFEENIEANEEYHFLNNEITDPLTEKLYPINLKTSSFNDYQRHVREALTICQKLKKVKGENQIDVVSQLCESQKKVKKQQIYKKVQKILQKEGYNFNKNEYRSFLAFLDFDQNNHITKQNLEKIIFKQSQRQRVDRLDRRKRNDNSKISTDRLNEESYSANQSNGDEFVDKMRSRSSFNWTSIKKSYIKEDNKQQFKMPTKFSAWPERLHFTDLSLIQTKSTTGMGVSQSNRFSKDEKHSLGLQDKLRKQRIYENKRRKTAQWQQINYSKLQQKSDIEQKKDLQKQYNLRLIKQNYQHQCHINKQ